MYQFTPEQKSALRELAGVAEVIRGCLIGTPAFDHAHQLHTWLAPTPSEHFATFGEVNRNYELLRSDLEALLDPAKPFPNTVLASRSVVQNLLRDLNRLYDQANRLF